MSMKCMYGVVYKAGQICVVKLVDCNLNADANANDTALDHSHYRIHNIVRQLVTSISNAIKRIVT